MPVKIGHALLYETGGNATALNFFNKLDGCSRRGSVEETFPPQLTSFIIPLEEETKDK